jgi:hypothetical protein
MRQQFNVKNKQREKERCENALVFFIFGFLSQRKQSEIESYFFPTAHIIGTHKRVGHTWTDHKTNIKIPKELNIITVLDKIQGFKRKWVQHVNRMPRNKWPILIKNYTQKGKRNQGRPLKRLVDV